MVTEAVGTPAARRSAPARTGLWSWVTTVDHKRIGALYLITTLFFFVSGGLMALAMRIQLEHSSNQVISADSYDRIFTMHGTTMIFLFVVPVMAAFGNYMVPLMIGARDMAFPRLNAASLWLLILGGLVMYTGFVWAPPTPAGPATRRSPSSRPATGSTSGSSASTWSRSAPSSGP
jgi:heme/copper-type cytochrome/quinol oxidase subunit 1